MTLEVNISIYVETVQASKIVGNTTTPALAGAWHRIATIAGNTFREAVRDRVLYNLVLFVLILTAAAVFIGELAYLRNKPATATVHVGKGALLVAWKHADLNRLTMKEESHGVPRTSAFTAISDDTSQRVGLLLLLSSSSRHE